MVVLVGDLCEGVDWGRMLRRGARQLRRGVRWICLLALSGDGAPAHDPASAAGLAALGVPVFACTPDLFPERMACAIERRDLARWAAQRKIVVAR